MLEFTQKSSWLKYRHIFLILLLISMIGFPVNSITILNFQEITLSDNSQVVFIPILEWSPKRHDFGNISEGRKYHTSFEIWNSGTDSMEWTLDIRDPYVSVDPISGVSSGEHDIVNVTIDTSGLSYGSYEGNVYIHSQGDFIFFTTFTVVPQELSYAPNSYDFGRVLKNNTYSTTLSIWNNGSDYLYWNLLPSAAWIHVHPENGISNGTIDIISVEIGTTLLDYSQTHANVTILTNAGNGVFFIDFTLNHKPLPPLLFGSFNGSVRKEYYYTISGEDVDNDSLYYYIDWGDGSNTGWIGPFENSEEVVQSHSWIKPNTYELKAKSKDEYGEESQWTTQRITLPFSYHFDYISTFISYIQKWSSNVQNE